MSSKNGLFDKNLANSLVQTVVTLPNSGVPFLMLANVILEGDLAHFSRTVGSLLTTPLASEASQINDLSILNFWWLEHDVATVLGCHSAQTFKQVTTVCYSSKRHTGKSAAHYAFSIG